MNIKRLVKLSVILVLCLFAMGVANAETYDGECYYETIVPNFGSFIDELHSEAHIDHTTNTLQYCYNIETAQYFPIYRDLLLELDFKEMYYLKDGHETNYGMINVKNNTVVFFGITCNCESGSADNDYVYVDVGNSSRLNEREYPKVCVNLQTGVR